MQCCVESVTVPPVSRVQVSGELDLVAAPQVLAVVRDAMDAGCATVLLDLGEVTFIDCAGVTVLLACIEEACAAGGELRVTEMSGSVVRLLQLTGTTDRLSQIPEPA